MLAFVNGRYRLAAAGGRLPADVAVIVVWRVVPIVAEFSPRAGQALGAIATGTDERRPDQRLVAANFEQVGIDLHRLGGDDGRVDPRQPQDAAIAEIY